MLPQSLRRQGYSLTCFFLYNIDMRSQLLMALYSNQSEQKQVLKHFAKSYSKYQHLIGFSIQSRKKRPPRTIQFSLLCVEHLVRHTNNSLHVTNSFGQRIQKNASNFYETNQFHFQFRALFSASMNTYLHINCSTSIVSVRFTPILHCTSSLYNLCII